MAPELGIRLEAGVDNACDNPAVVQWVRDHGVDPTTVYALDVFSDELIVHTYCTQGGRKHIVRSHPDVLTITKPDVDPDAICVNDAKRIRMLRPFPAGVMAGPGHTRQDRLAKAGMN